MVLQVPQFNDILDIIRRAFENRDFRWPDIFGDFGTYPCVKLDLFVNVAQFHVGQRKGQDTPAWFIIRMAKGEPARRKCLKRIVVIVQRESDLFQVVVALGASRCLSRGLYGRQ